MEAVAPPLELVLHIKFSLIKGQPLSLALADYLGCEAEGKENQQWKEALHSWFKYQRSGALPQFDYRILKTPYRKAVLSLLECGLEGQPIFEALEEIEKELIAKSESDILLWSAALPFKALVPLLLFQFPAIVILILLPLLQGAF